MKDRIGSVAGDIWRTLEEKGPLAVDALPKRLKGTTSKEVYMALGWLAREDQVQFVGDGGKATVDVRRA